MNLGLCELGVGNLDGEGDLDRMRIGRLEILQALQEVTSIADLVSIPALARKTIDAAGLHLGLGDWGDFLC